MSFNVLKLSNVCLFTFALAEVQISAGNLFQVTGAFQLQLSVSWELLAEKESVQAFQNVDGSNLMSK